MPAPPPLNALISFLFPCRYDMQGNMVNELGEARYVRKLRGQSELWNVVEAVLLGLVCAAFCFRMVAFSSDVIQVCVCNTLNRQCGAHDDDDFRDPQYAG